MQKYLQREYNKKSCDDTVQFFAQEPTYDREDEEYVLKDLQIKRLHDPDGLLEIDHETLVFSVHPDLALLQFIADTARPAMIFYNEIPEDVEWENYKLAKLDKDGQVCPSNAEAHDQTSPRVQRLVQNYEKHDFAFPPGYLAREKRSSMFGNELRYLHSQS